MKPRKMTTVRSVGRTADYLAAGGKKTVLAFGLVAIMAVMWFRVLSGRRPSSATASSPARNAGQQDPPGPQVQFYDLPIIPGRNDRIDRDFFAVRDWNRFSGNTSAVAVNIDPEVPVAAPDRTREVIERVAQRLKLEAVLEFSENPKIFINDRLLHVGEKIALREGAETYEFEVVRIEADKVFVRCRERELTIQLSQSHDVDR